MPLGISTQIVLPERLNPGHLDAFQYAGAAAIEVFASRHHFDYTQRNAVREIANWFRANPVVPTMHMPIFTEAEETDWSRHTQPTLNLISRTKSERIVAMDEVKRAFEAAEQIPFRSCVLHLGLKDDRWSTETLDLSLTAVEHLKAFATPLGVQLLLENIPNDLASPAHLVEITRVGHFGTVGFCLDTGHAHLAQPMQPDQTGYDRASRERLREQWGDTALKDALPEAFAIFADRLVELHIHDNSGSRDEHLWPNQALTGQGIDWGVVRTALSQLSRPTIDTLEIAYDAYTAAYDLGRKFTAAQRLLYPLALEQ